MFSIQNKYYKKILISLVLFFFFLIPFVTFADIQWGVVLYNYESGNGSFTDVRTFEQFINKQAPSYSMFAANAQITPEPEWFLSGNANALNYITFYLSMDSDLDIGDSFPDHAILSVPFSGTVDYFEIAFFAYQNFVSVPKLQRYNNDGSLNQESMTKDILNETLPAEMNPNNENQDFYICANRNNGLEDFNLGCVLLKKNIINLPENETVNDPGGTDQATNPDNLTGSQMEFDKLKNPLCATSGDSTVCSKPIESVTEFIERILNIVIMIGIPIVVLAIIWAGFLYIKAQGNPEKLKEANKTLIWTVVGAALLMGAWAIANAIKETVVEIGTEGISMQNETDTHQHLS